MYSKAIEDYLEAIYSILKEKGHARTKDISEELKISPPSVTEMLQRMSEKGLVEYERYGGVKLTSKGEDAAKEVEDRHNTLKSFLEILGVSEKTAEKDACKLEHEISEETFLRIKGFLRK